MPFILYIFQQFQCVALYMPNHLSDFHNIFSLPWFLHCQLCTDKSALFIYLPICLSLQYYKDISVHKVRLCHFIVYLYVLHTLTGAYVDFLSNLVFILY